MEINVGTTWLIPLSYASVEKQKGENRAWSEKCSILNHGQKAHETDTHQESDLLDPLAVSKSIPKCKAHSFRSFLHVALLSLAWGHS